MGMREVNCKGTLDCIRHFIARQFVKKKTVLEMDHIGYLRTPKFAYRPLAESLGDLKAINIIAQFWRIQIRLINAELGWHQICNIVIL